MEDSGSSVDQLDRLRLVRFLVKLTNGKPVQYYAQHVKNLAIFGLFSQNKVINRILGTYMRRRRRKPFTVGLRRCFDFFENPQAGCNLRRLTIQLEVLPTWVDAKLPSPLFCERDAPSPSGRGR